MPIKTKMALTIDFRSAMNNNRTTEHSGFFLHIFAFFQKLKINGLDITLRQKIDTCRSLKCIDILNFEDFYSLLKINIVNKKQDQGIFDAVFFAHWRFPMAIEAPLPPEAPTEDPSRTKNINEIKPGGREPEFSGEKTHQAGKSKKPQSEAADTRSAPGRRKNGGLSRDNNGECELATYSPIGNSQKKQIKTNHSEDLDRVKKTIQFVVEKLNFRKGRRRTTKTRGASFDIRKTIRKSIRNGGEFHQLFWKQKKITKTRIVLLCDISGSMESYNQFLLQFIYSLQNVIKNTETFAFSTRISRITPMMRCREFDVAMKRISRSAHDWSGGTQIGGCLNVFNQQYASTLLYGKSIVIIISDGWDVGNPDILYKEMKRLRKKAHRIIWLNPLMDSPAYEPTCIGMKTALPFVDQFLPLNNVDSLITLGHALHKIH